MHSSKILEGEVTKHKRYYCIQKYQNNFTVLDECQLQKLCLKNLLLILVLNIIDYGLNYLLSLV